MNTTIGADFKPRDKVEFCGDHATVISNLGSGGYVDLGEGQHCYWYWIFEGTPVTRVE